MRRWLRESLMVLMLIVTVATVMAPIRAEALSCPPGQTAYVNVCCPSDQEPMSNNIIKGKVLDTPSSKTCCPKGTAGDEQACFFAKYVNPTIRLLSAVAGVAAIIGIIIGGLRYASSAGESQKVAKAKDMIIRSLTGFVAFLFLAAFIQFLSPGGSKTTPAGSGSTVAQRCAQKFMGIKPWYWYLPDAAFADNGGTCDINNLELLPSDKSRTSDLVPVALAVIDGLLRISSVVAVAFVIVGGVKYTTSQGEPSETAQAKDSIINAIIGLVIVIMAMGIVSFIGGQLAK